MGECNHIWVAVVPAAMNIKAFEVCVKCRTTRDVGTVEAKPAVPPCPELPPGWEWTGEYRMPKAGDFYFSDSVDGPAYTYTDFVVLDCHILRRANPSTESKGSPDHVADPSKMVPDRAELFALYAAFISDGGHLETSYDDAVKALETFNRKHGEAK